MTDDTFNSNNQQENDDNAKDALSNTPSAEQKREIATWVNNGMGLSDVQKKINSDFGIVMSYMDVRFLVDDLDLTLIDKEEEKPAEKSEDGADSNPTPDSSLDGNESSVTVELDTVNPPGAMASGTVRFSDGETKKWTLDQFGRLGLSGGEDGYKPSDEDVAEFQKQLDSALRGRGF